MRSPQSRLAHSLQPWTRPQALALAPRLSASTTPHTWRLLLLGCRSLGLLPLGLLLLRLLCARGAAVGLVSTGPVRHKPNPSACRAASRPPSIPVPLARTLHTVPAVGAGSAPGIPHSACPNPRTWRLELLGRALLLPRLVPQHLCRERQRGGLVTAGTVRHQPEHHEVRKKSPSCYVALLALHPHAPVTPKHPSPAACPCLRFILTHRPPSTHPA